MSTALHVSLDAFGRLTIPDEIRKRLGLSPGSSLSIEAIGDREIRLVPEETPGTEERDGLLVITAVPTVDIAGAVDADREERIRELWGRERES